MYRIPGCGKRRPFTLASYKLDVLHRVRPPAEGDWAALVFLHAPAAGNGTHEVAVAISVVTCRRACHITGFYGLGV